MSVIPSSGGDASAILAIEQLAGKLFLLGLSVYALLCSEEELTPRHRSLL